jgi:hypothetical protein
MVTNNGQGQGCVVLNYKMLLLSLTLLLNLTITLLQLFHFISFIRTNDTLVTNVVLNGITEGGNVIVKFNDTVWDNVDFVVLVYVISNMNI